MEQNTEQIQVGRLTAEHIGRMVDYVGDGDGGRGFLPIVGIHHQDKGWTELQVRVFDRTVDKLIRSDHAIRLSVDD